MATILHKRGDTFSPTLTLRDGTTQKAPVDLTGATIKSEIRTSSGVLVQLLTPNILTQSGATLGKFTLSATYAETSGWPIGSHQCDVQYTFNDGTRQSTHTFIVQVVEDITSP